MAEILDFRHGQYCGDDDDTPLHARHGYRVCEGCGDAFPEDDTADTSGGIYCTRCLIEQTYKYRHNHSIHNILDMEAHLRLRYPWMAEVYAEGYRQRCRLVAMALRRSIGNCSTFKWTGSVRQLLGAEVVEGQFPAIRLHLMVLSPPADKRYGIKAGDEMIYECGPEVLRDETFIKNTKHD